MLHKSNCLIVVLAISFAPAALADCGTPVSTHRSTVAASNVQRTRHTKGPILLHGGGTVSREVWDTFIALAGGPDANFVVIPSADDQFDPEFPLNKNFPFERLAHVTVLHTLCRGQADSEEFVEPLKTADAVWIGGGRPFRLVDTYLNTRTERELRALLARGGVIGGTSGGAIIQASYLVRGGILSAQVLMAPGREQGFGFLPNVAIDEVVDARGRVEQLARVVALHPQLLGIGLESGAAIVARDLTFEVISGDVAISDGGDHDGKRYLYLHRGDAFDLRARRRIKR